MRTLYTLLAYYNVLNKELFKILTRQFTTFVLSYLHIKNSLS